MAPDLHEAIQQAYNEHREAVWGVCYRMTGSVSDADELSQEAYLRLRERPPASLERPLRGWLVTVAANLCRDRLRKRSETSYQSTWLPAPIAAGETQAWVVAGFRDGPQESPEQRLRRLESVSYAFLVALETLTPNQRAVLLLRDVYELSVRETAEALELSESNVKTTHHRARNRLEATDNYPSTGVESLGANSASAIAKLLECLENGDFERLAKLLRDDVRLYSDGGDGEFVANTRQLVGVDRVRRFIEGLHGHSEIRDVRVETLNAQAALVATLEPQFERQAPRVVLQIRADDDGRIGAMYLILASDKIAHLFESRGSC